jgi:hypothetical protein
MAIDFDAEKVVHNTVSRFVPACLPDAKKPYYLKAQFQQEVDLHGVASMGELYNVHTDPKVIEEGMDSGFRIIRHLIADGYRVKTPLFTIWMRIPGEYMGDETHLPAGIFPEARIRPSRSFSQYLRDFVNLVIAGRDDSKGHIGMATDGSNGQDNETCTQGQLLTVEGSGLKIEGDADHTTAVGLFFETLTTPGLWKAQIVAVNEPRLLKVIVPNMPTPNVAHLKIVTQSSVKNGAQLLKGMREIYSDFTLEVQ